ncbi:MAG: hypothetical protein V4858_24895 [Pseudomonadota bacterium]
MHTREPSPILKFTSRIERLPLLSQQLIAAFLAQASYENVNQFLLAINWTKKLQIESVLSDVFWLQLSNAGEVSFPYNYEDVEDGTLNLLQELTSSSMSTHLQPAPSPALLQESLYIFLNCCKFFSGIGNVTKMLGCLDNCIGQKVDGFFNRELKMNFHEDNISIGLEKIYEFPVYRHAIVDLDWLVLSVEQYGEQRIPFEIVNSIRIYAEHSETLILRRALFA